MISRRTFLTVGATPLFILRRAGAQSAGKTARIGLLTLAVTPSSAMVEAFRQGLRDHGYVEGRNVGIEYRDADRSADRLPTLAAELVRSNVDVIVTESNVAALAAKHATQTIPIVTAIAGDPVDAGVAQGLARPGGNVTGLTLIHPELSGKRLQLLKEAVPKVELVAVVWNPNDPAAASFLRETESAARSLGLRLHTVTVKRAEDLATAFAEAQRSRAEAFILLPSAFFGGQSTRLVALATHYRLPTIYNHREFTESGGLMSYGPDLTALFRRAASFVDKILKGAKPADLPIEQPTKFELVINLKTAKALGLTIPPSLLLRADQVIQ